MTILGVDYYPEHWPADRWPADARLMHESGLQVVRLAEFAWARMEPAEGQFEWDWLDRAVDVLSGAGLQVILGTPTAAPPAWLTRAYPDILPVDAQRRTRSFGGRRHYCPNSPTYRAHTRRIVAALAGRYGGHAAVIGWQIDNEFGGGQTARCYCEDCAAAFRQWLRRRYGDLDALNDAWGAVFWSQTYTDWEQIEPPGLANEKPNPSHGLDYDRFASDSWVDYQQLQLDVLRAHVAPAQFVTTNLMALFTDLDYFKLAGPLDFVTWDNYPTGQTERWGSQLYPPPSDAGADGQASHAYDVGDPMITGLGHDLMRGLKDQPFWVMEQQPGYINWGRYNPTPVPGVVRLWTWEDVAHGADAVVYFRWRACLYAQEQYHSGLLRHDGAPDQGLHDVRALKAERALLDAVRGATVAAEVALLLSYEDLWALDSQPHHGEFGYLRHLFTYYRALQRAGVGVDIAPPARELDPSRYKLVVAPTLHLVDEAHAENLRRYVAGGGHLLLSIRSGFKTTSNRVVDTPLPGLLRDLVGATVAAWHSLPPGVTYLLELVEMDGPSRPKSSPKAAFTARIWAEALEPHTAASLARFTGGPLAGRAAAVVNHVGRGQVVYWGMWADDAMADAVLGWMVEAAGVESAAAEVPPGVKVLRRRSGADEFLFLLNLGAREASVLLTSPDLTDAHTGQPAGRSVQLAPRAVRVLRRAL